MTTEKSKDDTKTSAPASADKANAEVQAKVDEAEEKGYIGFVPDEVPNSAYNLTSGPDGVPLVEDNRTRVAQASLPEGDAK
jgi:hypothetical protein